MADIPKYVVRDLIWALNKTGFRCADMHHPPKFQHRRIDPCPLETEIALIIELAEQRIGEGCPQHAERRENQGG